MSSFDLDKYETVKMRKKRFYDTYQDGRIIVEILSHDKILEYALFKAIVYKDRTDCMHANPLSTGYAFEIRDKELSVASSGKKYESVNYTSWTENAEESAVGRALDNAGFASNMRCSREEIEKAERQKDLFNRMNVLGEIRKALKEKFPDVVDQKKLLESKAMMSWSEFSQLDIDSLKEFLNHLGE